MFQKLPLAKKKQEFHKRGCNMTQVKCLGYIRPGQSAWAQVIPHAKLQMHSQLVQDEAPGHGLLALDKLQMRSQSVQDKALQHELFEDELQIPRQFVQDEALEHGLFEDKVQMTRPFAQDEAPGHGLFEDVKFK